MCLDGGQWEGGEGVVVLGYEILSLVKHNTMLDMSLASEVEGEGVRSWTGLNRSMHHG